MQVIELFEGQLPVAKRLKWSGINPDSFYYKSKSGKSGRKPSSTSLKTDGGIATNHEIVEEIKNILAYSPIKNRPQRIPEYSVPKPSMISWSFATK